MNLSKVKLVYYSPTGTGKTTGIEIAKGTGLNYESIDLTPASNESKNYTIANDELGIIVIPVYGGRIAPVALDRIKHVTGNSTPAVLVAMYGNREYEDALLELKNVTEGLGFKAVAGSAFIGRHSFDTEDTPIASGRPDSNDIEKAHDFGAKIIEKINGLSKISDLKVSGNYPYKERGGGGDPRSPETNPETCILCATCEGVCPVGCIEVSDIVETDKTKCTACTACVQVCPTGARHWAHNGILGAAKWLSTNCSKRKEPEFFL
jgi:ferredoxin